MNLEFVPLLQLQRDLYAIPRGLERFQAYLKTMLNADASDIELLPLSILNPMGKDHIPALLDALLSMQADQIAAAAIAEVSQQFERDPGRFKLGLIVADDQLGGWTNRYTSEFSARFELEASLKRGWLTGILWSSETPSGQRVREAALTPVYRAAYQQRQGTPRTLQAMLQQEGYALSMAGCQQPQLAPDDLVYTREMIAPYLSTQDYPTIFACLFGDRAAQALGYRPRGLSDDAGLALALHDASH
jgi:hypothetical protein